MLTRLIILVGQADGALVAGGELDLFKEMSRKAQTSDLKYFGFSSLVAKSKHLKTCLQVELKKGWCVLNKSHWKMGTRENKKKPLDCRDLFTKIQQEAWTKNDGHKKSRSLNLPFSN